MEIQRGKEGMKDMLFNRQIGATAGCTVRALLGTIPPEATGRFGIRADAWFGSVRTANEIGIRGHEGVFQVKTYHASYPKDFIEATLKDAPGGVSIVLEGTTRDEVPLVAVGYRYSRKSILHFVLTKNAGTTKNGEPYHMKYTDGYGNVCTRYVDRPAVLSEFFAKSNIIDTHNQLRQSFLKLEKKWMTQKSYFRLATTYLGINVTDAYLLCNYHKVINSSKSSLYEEKEQKIGIQRFSGMLARQLIDIANKIKSSSRYLPEQPMEVTMHPMTGSSADLSSPTFLGTSATYNKHDKLPIRSLVDANGVTHYLMKYDVTKDPSGRQRTKMRACKLCLGKGNRRDVGYYCYTCDEKMALCTTKEDRDCFREHVASIRRNTRHSNRNASLP
jgi:hypothetical protein